jgi:hypothetical protein
MTMNEKGQWPRTDCIPKRKRSLGNYKRGERTAEKQETVHGSNTCSPERGEAWKTW